MYNWTGLCGFSIGSSTCKRKKKKKFRYKVFGYDNDAKKVETIIKSVKNKKLPFKSQDNDLIRKFKNSSIKNEINVLENIKNIQKMDIIVLSVGFDFFGNKYSFKKFS